MSERYDIERRLTKGPSGLPISAVPAIHVWDFGPCCTPGQACGLWLKALGNPPPYNPLYWPGVYNPLWQQQNHDMWLAFGSPAVGDFNSFMNGYACIEYLGLIPLSALDLNNLPWGSIATNFLNPSTVLYADCASCAAPPTWDCDNSTGNCFDPGTGQGTYTSLSVCQSNCKFVKPSWDCNNGVCTDPGTGNGQYTSLFACQSSTSGDYCK